MNTENQWHEGGIPPVLTLSPPTHANVAWQRASNATELKTSGPTLSEIQPLGASVHPCSLIGLKHTECDFLGYSSDSYHLQQGTHMCLGDSLPQLDYKLTQPQNLCKILPSPAPVPRAVPFQAATNVC